MLEFPGGCHCGNITFVLTWPLDDGLVLRKCGCSFCTKQGVIYTAHPKASLAVIVSDAETLGRYEFDTRTAWCCFCLKCGIYIFAMSIIDEREYAVINVNTLKDFIPPPMVKVMNFENETPELRLARRSHTWISNFTMTIADTSPSHA